VAKISRIVDQFSSSLKPIELRRDSFDLGDEIKSVQASLKKVADERGVDILYSKDSPVVVFADRLLLSQAIQNLVRNAVEASEGGQVGITVKSERKKVFISVKDSGEGLNEEEKARIFEPFYSTKKGGMGIGLYLTQKIVKAHGGDLDLVSSAKKGTVFTICIPGG
jgi:signal transduction histidine kinase